MKTTTGLINSVYENINKYSIAIMSLVALSMLLRVALLWLENGSAPLVHIILLQAATIFIIVTAILRNGRKASS